MFRTDLLSSITTALADSHQTSMTNTNCCECSIKTPDDGLCLSETRRVIYQNKVEK